jgi:MFS family permease
MYGLAVLFLCLEMAIQISPNVMALHLMKDLKLNSLDLGLMSGAYFYTYALMQIPAGLLLDKYKAKFVITGALIVCLTGTFLFSHSNSLYVLTFSRLLMGAGSAFAFISVLVVTADLFPHKYFSGMTSVTQFFACLGAVAGTYYLNKIVLFYGWRPTMQIFTGAAILLACLTAMCLNYTKQKSLAIKKSDTPLSIKEKLKKILHQRQTWWIGLYSFLTWAPMTGFASLWSRRRPGIRIF